jgi:hypothetical protein
VRKFLSASLAAGLALAMLASCKPMPEPPAQKPQTRPQAPAPAPVRPATPPVAESPVPAAAPVVEAPVILDREVTCLTDSVVVGLPVALRLSWKNPSKRSALLNAEAPRAVTVEKSAGGPVRRLFLPMPAQGQEVVTLDSHKSATRTVLLVMGRPADQPDAPLEWLFPEAGQYRLTVEEFPTDGPMVVTVQEPPSEGDRDARRNWTLDLAATLAGETSGIAEMSVQTQAEWLLSLSPKSVYAGYAVWAEAKRLADSTDRKRQDAAVKACQTVLDKYGEMPVGEAPAETLVELYHATGQGARAQEAARALALKYPESAATLRLRQEYGPGFDGLVAPPAAPIVTGSPPSVTPKTTPPASAKTTPAAPPKPVPNLGGEKTTIDAFGQRLGVELTGSFTAWRITDGRSLRAPYEDIKRMSGVSGQVIEDRTSWNTASVVLSGAKRDQLIVAGMLQMAVKGAGGKVQWLYKRAVITLVPDGRGNVILQGVRLDVDPPASIGPPPPHT